MNKQFQLLITGLLSLYSMSAYSDQPANYLNFVMAENISDMSIDINNSCYGAGINIPSNKISTGFYKNGNYYLKVKEYQNHSNQCWQNFKQNFIYNNYNETINYFPDFPKEELYQVTRKDYKIIMKHNNVYVDRIYYTPYYLFFSITGNITLTWSDNNNLQTSTIPISFILGQTEKRKQNTWFIVGDNQATFNSREIVYAGYDAQGYLFEYTWYTGINLYDQKHNQYFCLSSNLKDNNTIKVTVDKCKSHQKIDKFWDKAV